MARWRALREAAAAPQAAPVIPAKAGIQYAARYQRTISG
jgi:hypothetical protein